MVKRKESRTEKQMLGDSGSGFVAENNFGTREALR